MALGSGSSTVAITSIASSLLIDSLKFATASKSLVHLLSLLRSVQNERCSFRRRSPLSIYHPTRGFPACQNLPLVQSREPCPRATACRVRELRSSGLAALHAAWSQYRVPRTLAPR